MKEEALEEIQSAASTVAEAGASVAKQTRNFFHLDELSEFFTLPNLAKTSAILITILIMYIVYKIVSRIVKKHAKKKFEPHTAILISKLISYIFYALVAMYILSLLGINMTAVWGAAGVAGIAIGFAAQTTISNFISGIFVLSEKAVKIGDFISVGDVSGTVTSVGLLSARISTPDNQMIRIPNSSVINSNLINYSHFKIRRILFEVSLSFDTDLPYALETFKKLPALCPTVLQDPAPVFFFDGFGSGVLLRIGLWFNSPDLLQTKNDVYINIVKLCRENGISIPFPRYDISIIEESKKTPPASPSAH